MSINSLLPLIRTWLQEDDLNRNYHYTQSLSDKPVQLTLKIKSDLLFSGTDFFIAVFVELGIKESDLEFLRQYEGKNLKKGEVIVFPHPMPFAVAVTGERLALNLLHHSSAISSHTQTYVQLSQGTGIKILDTRKTTPGLRMIEKYAVRVGGGFNHRFGQTDTWMVKDNHKTCLGGLTAAVDFFNDQGCFYNEMVVEVHNLQELQEAQSLGIKHVMLDNFNQDDIVSAITMKQPQITYEISGGISLANLATYLIPGIDCISTSDLMNPPKVDISLKFKPIKP